MRKTLLRAWFGVFIFACVLGLALSRHSGMQPAIATTPTPVPSASATPTPPATALTSPGQTITNAASATYSDGTNTYNILSNTVTVYVQNAPSLVVLTNNGTSAGAVLSNGLTPAASPVPGNYLSDVYTLVNTGNGTGYFQVATAAAASPTPLPATNNGVTQSGPETGVTYTLSCNSGAYNATDATVAALNTDLSTNCTGVTANGSVNIAVNYQANSTGTVNTQLEAQVIYSGSGTGYAAASSLWVTNTYADPITADERVDIQKSPGPIDSTGNVTYSIYANNGGNSPANYVNSYGATCSTSVKVCGSALTGPGILIADKVPNGVTTPLPVISMSPSPGPQSLSLGETVAMVYTSDATAKTGWTSYSGGGFPAGTAYVGVYLTGNASRIGLPADPTPATTTGPGSVVPASSQIGWTMKVGPIPANISVNNVITAPVGDNKQCIEGPGLTTTATACDASGPNPNPGSTSPGDPTIPLTTPAPSNSPIPGLSNTATIVAPSLFNGPLTQPDAQGCFNSNATPVPFPTWSPMPVPFPTVSPTTQPTCPAGSDNQDDFTQAVSTPNPSTTQMPYGAQMAAASTVTVTNAVKNPGSQSNTYQLTFPTLPSTVTVTSVTYGAASCSTTSTPASGVYPLGSIGAGASIQYCVTYTTATGASAPYYFQPIFVQLDVAYTSAPAVYYNNTWNVLMPGGFIEMAKTATVLSNGNCQFSITVPNNGVCPGGIIQYAVAYWNALPANASGSPAEPAGAKLSVNGNFVITEDGSANGSNWTTYTGGMYDVGGAGVAPLAASQTIATMALNCGVVTLKCGDSNATTFGGFTSPNGNLYGSTKFTDTIPSAVLTPQSGGVLMFAAKVH